MARNEIWRMPYTKDQLQNAVTNQVPVIGNNGNWWRWDIAPQKFVDTGTPANTAGISPYQITGRNLLDNWYFRNPVNQRSGYVVPPGTTYYPFGSGTPAGTTSEYVTVYEFDSNGYGHISVNGNSELYVAPADCVRGYTGAGYTIDRWFMHAGDTLLLRDDGIIISSNSGDLNFHQVLDAALKAVIIGQAVTISALIDSVSGGEYPSFTLSIGNDTKPDYSFSTPLIHNAGLATFTGVIPPSWDKTDFMRWTIYSPNNPTIKIRAVKLELGTQQTLAHQDANGNWVLNDTQDYGEELAKCMRHQEVSVWYCSEAVANETHYITFAGTYFFKVAKRITPNIYAFASVKPYVYDFVANTEVPNCELVYPPLARNSDVFSPEIYNSDGAFVVGRLYRVIIGDNACFIDANL